ncbi:hypothetical protein ASC87_01875 [Rhizobacter sp. Root1221]|nr:hypothetical protein ASC87_01875 [Rhizobacter sp. Root1221]
MGRLATPARAEGQLRIAEQFGIVYLLLNVAQDQKLIEKHGKQLGQEIKVEFVKLSGGAAANDALLSGSIDVAGAGVGPLLTLWDRTRGKQGCTPPTSSAPPIRRPTARSSMPSTKPPGS